MRLQSFAASLTPPNPKSTSIQDALLERSFFSRLCFQGVIDSPSWIRPEAWKVLLGLLGNDKLGWPEQLARSRESYYVFVHELLYRLPKLNEPAPVLDSVLAAIDKDIKRTHLTLGLFAQPVPAHPHSPFSHTNKSRIRNRRRLFDRIESINPSTSDGLRERPVRNNSQLSTDNDDSDDDALQDCHWEALERLLYVYATLNPSHGYVQGMNQIVAPLYLTFSLDSRQDHACHAEADAFTCFSYLMAETKDFLLDSTPSEMFQHTLSSSTSSSTSDNILDAIPENYGIGLGLRNLSLQIVWLDSQLAASLTNAQVHPFHYAYPWFLTLFGQSFSMPDLCRIFDSVFALVASSAPASSSDLASSTTTITNGGNTRSSLEVSTSSSNSIDPSAGGLRPTQAFLVDLASAIVILKRTELLGADFKQATSVLQDYFCDDVDVLLQSAFTIRDRRMAADLTGDGPFLNNNSSIVGGFNNTSGAAAGLKKKLVDAAAARFSSHRLSTSSSSGIVPPSPHRSESMSSLSSFSSPIVNVTSPKDPPPAASLFTKYTKAFAESDAAASLAKASTNARIAMASSSSSWKSPTTVSMKDFFNRSSSPVQDAPFLPPIDDEDRPRASRSWFSSSTSTPPRKSSSLHPDDDETEKLGDVSFESRVSNSGNRRRPLYLSSAARPAGTNTPPPGSAVTDASVSSRRSSLCSSTAGDGIIGSGNGRSYNTPYSASSRTGMRSPSPRTGSGPFQYRSSVSNSSAASTSNDFSSKLAVFEQAGNNNDSPVVPRPRGASISSAKFNQQMSQQQQQQIPPLPGTTNSSSTNEDTSFSSPPRLQRFQKAYGNTKGLNEWGSPSSSFDGDTTTVIAPAEVPSAKIVSSYQQKKQANHHQLSPLHLDNNKSENSNNRGYQLTDAPMDSITPTPESVSFADSSQSHTDDARNTIEFSDIMDKDTLSAGASSLGGVPDRFPLPDNISKVALAEWKQHEEYQGEKELEKVQGTNALETFEHEFPDSRLSMADEYDDETSSKYSTPPRLAFSTRQRSSTRTTVSSDASSSSIVAPRIASRRRPSFPTDSSTTSAIENSNTDTLKRFALSDAPFDEKALEDDMIRNAQNQSTTPIAKSSNNASRSSIDGRRKRYSSSRRVSAAAAVAAPAATAFDEMSSGGSGVSSRQSWAPSNHALNNNNYSTYNDETVKRLSRSSWRGHRSSIHSIPRGYEEEADPNDDYYQYQQPQQQSLPPNTSTPSSPFVGSKVSLPKSPKAFKNSNSASVDSPMTSASRTPRGTSFAHPPLGAVGSHSVDISSTSTSGAPGSFSSLVEIDKVSTGTGSKKLTRSRKVTSSNSGGNKGNERESGSAAQVDGGNQSRTSRRRENASTSSVVAAAIARVEGRSRSSSTAAANHYIPQSSASSMASNRASIASNLSSSSEHRMYLDDLKYASLYSSNLLASSSASSLPYANPAPAPAPTTSSYRQQQFEAEPFSSSSARNSYSSIMSSSSRLRPPDSVAPLRIDGQNHSRTGSTGGMTESSRSPASSAWDEDKILDSY